MAISSQDTFAGRTVGSGLGTASNGETWAQLQGTSAFSVSGGEGNVVTAGGTNFNYWVLGTTVRTSDEDLRMRFSIATSSDVVGLILRVQDVNNFYFLRYQSGQLTILKNVGGAQTSLQSTSITVNTATFYTMRFQFVAGNLLGKMWQSSGTEPTSWTVTASDTTFTTGKIGFYAGPNSASTPIQFDSLLDQANYVSRVNSTLYYQNKAFKFIGANAFWTGLSQASVSFPTPRYPTSYEVDDILGTFQQMGVIVARMQTLGMSVGSSLAVEPSLGTFDETALRHIDYVIFRAAAFGIKLWIPLVDYNFYYEGGMQTFTQWRSLGNQLLFYTNSQVISDFQQYVSTLLNRVNIYTGVAYKNDDTIAFWETGNELQNQNAGQPFGPFTQAPSTWTQTMSDYIKNIDDMHLVIDGSYGVASANLSIASVDCYNSHYYGPDSARLASDASATSGANKCYVVGEFDWKTVAPSVDDSFVNAFLTNAAVNGICYWNVQPHHPHGNYAIHNDGYSLYYPGQQPSPSQYPNESDVNRIDSLVSDSFGIQSNFIQQNSIPIIGSPLLISVSTPDASGNVVLKWQGKPGAYSYDIQANLYNNNGPWATIETGITDFQVPVTVRISPDSFPYYFRILPRAASGTPGLYSNVLQSGQSLLVDDLCNFDLTFSASANLTLDATNPSFFQGDICRVKRISATAETVVYNLQNIGTLQAITYFVNGETISDFSFFTSPDNTTYTIATPIIGSTSGSNWSQRVYTLTNLPTGTNYIKTQWNNISGSIFSPQLGQVLLYGPA